jgi:SAM-dependent methyltransferase
MAPEALTPQQQIQRDKFNSRTVEGRELDLAHYEKARFGPWCPYWTVYSNVAQRVQPGHRLLVIGCGTGRDALIYARLGYRVDGIDISDRAVSVANNWATRYGLAHTAAFHVQTAERLDFGDQVFDAAVGVNVLHHVDTLLCIQETHRVLKPRSWAIFKEPMSTPVRDFLRTRPPITWVVPNGVKNRMTGELYPEEDPGEHLLNASDFRVIRDTFGNLTITRFHVLAKLSSVFGRRPMFEHWDLQLFKILPFVRLLGDQLILEVRKP